MIRYKGIIKFIIYVIFIYLILIVKVNDSQPTPTELPPLSSIRPILPTNRPPPPTNLACILNTCSLRGQPCTVTGNITENLHSESTCYVEDRCLNGTCVEGLGKDEKCLSSDDCLLGFSCVTPLSSLSLTLPNKTKTCQPSFFAEFGAPCTRATDCLHSLDCINNTCSTPLYGCLSDLSCRNDSICINGTCSVYILKENECFMYRSYRCRNSNNNPCTLKSLNESSIGVCLEEIPIGNPCLTTKFSCDWKSGQVCRPLFPRSIIGRCVSIPKDEAAACTTLANCKPYEYCKCDSQSGVGYCVTRSFFFGRYCQAATKLFLNCFRETNCSQPFILNPLSCILSSQCSQLAVCVAQYCTQPLLPVTLCANRKCEVSVFEDETVRELITNSQTNLKIPYYIDLSLILLILFLIN